REAVVLAAKLVADDLVVLREQLGERTVETHAASESGDQDDRIALAPDAIINRVMGKMGRAGESTARREYGPGAFQPVFRYQHRLPPRQTRIARSKCCQGSQGKVDANVWRLC